MDDGFTPGYGDVDCGGSECEVNDDGVCEVCAFWRELASYKPKADGAKQLPVAASDDTLRILPDVGCNLTSMIPESEPDKLQDKDLHIFGGTELASFKHKDDGAKQLPVAASDDSLRSLPDVGCNLTSMIPESEPDKLQEKELHIFRRVTREYCRAQMRVTRSCAKKKKTTSASSPSTKPGYRASKRHDRAPVKLRVGSELLFSNLGGSYMLQSGATLSLQAKKKVEEKVQAIRPKISMFVKVMTRSTVDGTGCKTCEMVFCSEYGECLPNKSRKLVLQLEGKERQWQATLDIRSDIYCLQRKISKGWKEFTGENGLKVGDICLFKLEDTNTTSLKMTVYLIRKSQIEL